MAKHDDSHAPYRIRWTPSGDGGKYVLICTDHGSSPVFKNCYVAECYSQTVADLLVRGYNERNRLLEVNQPPVSGE